MNCSAQSGFPDGTIDRQSAAIAIARPYGQSTRWSLMENLDLCASQAMLLMLCNARIVARLLLSELLIFLEPPERHRGSFFDSGQRSAIASLAR
jgi:hypothetical protein